jgi:hypothetical protein
MFTTLWLALCLPAITCPPFVLRIVAGSMRLYRTPHQREDDALVVDQGVA